MTSSTVPLEERDHIEIELQSYKFDSMSQTYRAEYDPELTPPSLAVIAVFERVFDSSHLRRAPLDDMVDTDALNRLLAACDTMATGVEASFSYGGYKITVRCDEIIASATHKVEDGSKREGVHP